MLKSTAPVSLAPLVASATPRPLTRGSAQPNVFVNELLAVLKASIGRLGLTPENIQVAESDRAAARSAGNSPSRQIIVTLAQAEPAASPQSAPAAAPHVPFATDIPASDIGGINAQQTARNSAFQDWVGGIRQQLAAMGYEAEASFDREPENWYVLPTTATLHISGAGSESSCALTLYHYDAWQDMDSASLALDLANRSLETA